ncbi:monovalent cation/H+ antiporter subunit D [Marinomonas mediterranea]|jgi:multisubunit potassium/proton antiporter, PhaD subunit (2.A.63.1.1)|uniref:NADH dehydrogenase (Quinone) n=1 Tax=Marinomonas mediterranea (strain ATCC 700492 / JCM 21426 / NBRC 103028 / MMB-1) TaxID=717774 RepID=F2K0D1_MARM1|nr:monovalent cation/H+ antiporter subunit D [Marinomonas mediterranea]ADZ89846.1 NADH dehydrogenase (quinone) [Marinomonas mediterranea MMB-1]WCN07934.1 monovalent cation/H+ antiporter subunit D [Marinomonas mediterranea]WCN12029.1 monovalent cation/H+ antiporter subunit D [Marinomonas mediterranea]WCN16066.1 monovalent cation/H+ antiporter subunit D [Marinomonas mediterranea MMB-1]
MQHLAILPIILPLLTGALLLLPPFSTTLARQRIFAIASFAVQIVVAALLLIQTNDQGTTQYILGNWQAPFGIVLVADSMSTLLVLLCVFLAFCAHLYGCAGDDKEGAYFHPLFMFQVMGINGAFLTGDAFNLFVFFEVLLIASYALLIHGGGKQKTQATMHYVILNLVGSSVFLFGLGILYGTLGTLNMADMAAKVSTLDESNAILAEIGASMLLVVFGLKSALLPLQFWLPRTYASASAPVAAIFAIMTKVGIYSIFRVHIMIFGDHAGELANMAQAWLWPLALLTICIGTIGAFAAPTLKLLVANMVVLSAGSLLVCAAMQSEEATGAALYYLLHSTVITAGLFLVADIISKQRGKAEDRFVRSKALKQPVILGIAFAMGAIGLVGMPPLSGFVGKILILQAAQSTAEMIWVWPIMLISSLAALISLSRAGTTLFWRHSGGVQDDAPIATNIQLIAVFLLMAASPLLVLFGGPIVEIAQHAANGLHDPNQSVFPLLPSIQTGGAQ